MRLVLAAALVLTLSFAAPAAAQEEDRGVVDIGYEIGAFDAAARDWPVVAVEVRGALTDGDPFTVALTGDAGTIFSTTTPFQSPVTRVGINEFVGVADVTGVSVIQAFEVVTTIEILDVVEEPDPELPVEGVPEPEVAVIEFQPPTPLPTPEVTETAGGPTPSAGPGVVNRPAEVLGGGSGRDSGQLAVSVIVSLIVVVLAFRTPLPAASTQRWRT